MDATEDVDDLLKARRDAFEAALGKPGKGDPTADLHVRAITGLHITDRLIIEELTRVSIMATLSLYLALISAVALVILLYFRSQ